ncbi:DUF2382 domain-containing protein [Myxacorys almedinensis]|uniref:DUF2382 domain-containing protein n=1 Tax=Myxacorys almedinensis A TaxID=2690445 RepID=A0A8J7Z8D5_9CYAN|nr:DUF2382 domain-containing protein [Myxacorys almedinensis]NDJ19928.1 DUF2382 domain-containing protein [Myxacorys almedinensis A]
MPLLKIADFYPNYQQDSDLDNLKNFDVYAQDDKVGSVYDILVDSNSGRVRYFVVDTGFWIFGKKVLLPVGRAYTDRGDNRIYVDGMTREQVESLPDYDELEKVDYDYEEQVRGVYRPATKAGTAATATPSYDRNSYNYDYDADLYNYNKPNQDSLKLYEERLIANKRREKTGEVSIGKHVETQTSKVDVPVEKERVVIERSSPTSASAVTPGDAAFQEGQVAHMDVYEETPDIHKEAFVREEVKVRKEVEQDTVTAKESVRREQLDVDRQGRPVDKKR